MKAIIITAHGKVAVQDVTLPEMGPFESLVKIEACGLCGTTDRHLIEGCQAHHPSIWYPALLGHESVGKVIKVGEKVKKYKIGDRVTRPVAIWPGTQKEGIYSAWGGFAEYGIVRDAAAAQEKDDYTSARQHVVPETISLEDAVLATSVSEVASWTEKLGNIQGKSLVIGGTGFAAATMCQCAKMKGASHIIVLGRNPKKFKWAIQNGASHGVLLNQDMHAEIQKIIGSKADWFLDAAGNQEVFEAGIRLIKPGGNVAIYGAPQGFSYQLPLGAVGGDFSVHYFSPMDDLFYHEICQRIISGQLKAEWLRTHEWKGLESIHLALAEQAGGNVLKGLILI
ncbi:MAG: zinc-binding dehydrogenase [Verrucomicrobiota bacterium]